MPSPWQQDYRGYTPVMSALATGNLAEAGEVKPWDMAVAKLYTLLMVGSYIIHSVDI